MFAQLEEILISYIHTIPLEAFVFIASFIEEVVAPIPSPTVMVLSGFFANVQGNGMHILFLLALIGAMGKTLGALLVYAVSYKAGDIIVEKCGAFFGITNQDVEELGKKLTNSPRDYLLLTSLRALPFIPSVLVSVGSGVLKVPRVLFMVTTFLGTIVRDGFYLYVGYVGVEAFASIINHSASLETYIEFIIIGVVCFYLGYRVYKRKMQSVTK